MSVCMQRYLFYSFSFSPIPSWFTLLLKLLQLWAIRDSLGCLVCPFGMPPSYFRGARCYFLVLQNAPGSIYIISASALESTTFQRDPGSFCWRILRNQDLDTRCAHCQRGVTASRPSKHKKLRNTCMYTNHVYTHIWNYFYINLLVYTHTHKKIYLHIIYNSAAINSLVQTPFLIFVSITLG